LPGVVVEALARSDEYFSDTVSHGSKFGQAADASRAARLERLKGDRRRR